MKKFLNGSEFEVEVIRIARAIYGEHSQVGRELLAGRERDCIIRTRDEIVVVEATLDPRKEKTEFDARKTSDLVQLLRKQNNIPVNGILVVHSEPTDAQREVEKKYRNSLRMLSYNSFLSRLVDGRQYLNCRANYRFGSIIDPRNEEDAVAKRVHYVEVPLVVTTKNNSEIKPRDLAKELTSSSQRYLITGEFGVGKSMTLRHIFTVLQLAYLNNETRRVPIYLNLRDHAGQNRPAEALRTHCEDIGFSYPNDVVNAWRAGYVVPILDGFDEMSSPGWGRSLNKLRDYRFQAMQLVRSFVSETPQSSPIVLAGRSNYFDHHNEMIRSLGIGNGWSQAVVDELSPSHVQQILKSLGSKETVPEWLPPRPLLLSYFAAQSASHDAPGYAESLAPAEGWDEFLQRIAKREADQRGKGMVSPDTVRDILHRLATLARREPDGLGRFGAVEISTIFEQVAGYTPDADAQGLLLRLPGLRPNASGDGTRSFMDAEYASALKGGAIADYIVDPFNYPYASDFDDVFSSGRLAKSVASHRVGATSAKSGIFHTSLNRAIESNNYQLASDILLSWAEHGNVSVDYPLIIDGCEEPEFDFVVDSGDFSNVMFDNCMFGKLDIDDEFNPNKLPRFRGCLIAELRCAFKPESYASKMIESSIEIISDRGATNDSIMSLDIEEGARVLLTILRKLYSQGGAGRQRAALSRGLDQRFRAFVEPVIEICVQEGLCYEVKRRGSDLVVGSAKSRHRALQILARPQSTRDAALTRARRL